MWHHHLQQMPFVFLSRKGRKCVSTYTRLNTIYSTWWLQCTRSCFSSSLSPSVILGLLLQEEKRGVFFLHYSDFFLFFFWFHVVLHSCKSDPLSLSATPLMCVSEWERDIRSIMSWILICSSETEAHVKCSRASQLCFGLINYMEISEIIYSCISMSSGRWCERSVDDESISVQQCYLCAQSKCMWGFVVGVMLAHSTGQVRAVNERKMCDVWPQWRSAHTNRLHIHWQTEEQKLTGLVKNESTNKMPQFLYTIYSCHLLTLSYCRDHGSTQHKYTWGCFYL